MIACVVHVGSASGTPSSLKQKSVVTPSSGEAKTHASPSWKTPTSTVGRVAGESRAGRLDALACGTPPAVNASGTPSLLTEPLSTKTSDESILFPDKEELRFSQPQRPSHATPERGDGIIQSTLIPETLPDTALGVGEDDDIPPSSTGKVPSTTTMSEGTHRATSHSAEEDPETDMAGTDCQVLDMDTVHSGKQAVAEESPTVGKSSGKGTGSVGTRRQAALRNKLCPSPGATTGTSGHGGLVQGAKKPMLGRGRAGQGVTRAEKGCNMKPLAEIGVQEKFKAPAAVADAGKGRGRGGNQAKRKREGSMP